MRSLHRHPALNELQALVPMSCALTETQQCQLSTENTPESCQYQVRAQVTRCLTHAQRYWPDLPSPTIVFDLKGKSAGQAHFGRGALRFNLVLLLDHPRAFLEEVVPHEVAHWVDYHAISTQGKPHGPGWQGVMRHLYASIPRVTHSFDTSVSSPAPWRYRCGCSVEHWLTVRRHRRIERGHGYRCRRCGQRLRRSDCEAAR